MIPATTASLPTVPPELAKAGAKGHLVVLVGPNAAERSGFRPWNELLRALHEKAKEIAEPAQRTELEDLADWVTDLGEPFQKAIALRNIVGAERFRPLLADVLRSANAEPEMREALARSGSRLLDYDAIARLPGAVFVSWNHDTRLDTMLRSVGKRSPRVVRASDVEPPLAMTQGDIIKLHGDVDDESSIALTATDYDAPGYLNRDAWKRLLAALAQPPRVWLLLGFEHLDEKPRDVLGALRAASGAAPTSGFWVTTRVGGAPGQARAAALSPVWLDEPAQLAPWLEMLARAIRDEGTQHALLAKVMAYEGRVREQFEGDKRRAADLANRGDTDEALALFRKLAQEAEALIKVDPEADNLKRFIASCRANEGLCLLNLQRPTEARAVLIAAVEESGVWLSLAGRASAAQALAQLGEMDLARKILPETRSDMSDDERGILLESRQIVDVLADRALDAEPETPVVRSHVARAWVRKGRLDEGARAARKLLESSRNDVPVALHAAATLLEALQRTVLEDPADAVSIPIAEREQALGGLDDALSHLATGNLPKDERRAVVEITHAFYYLTADDRDLPELPRDLSVGATPVETPDDLVEQGLMDEAIRLAETPDHPWFGASEQARLFASAGRFSAALDIGMDIVERFPRRAPVERIAAMLLLQHGRVAEALPHARAAFEVLPGRGCRLIFGQVLRASGETHAAWNVLSPLTDSPDPRVLKFLAETAEDAGQLLQARAAWERYLEKSPDDAPARVRLSLVHFRLGDFNHGANIAWEAATLPGHERLPPEELGRIAEFQRAGGVSPEQARERMLAIVKELEERFPDNAVAEQVRFLIRAALGFPEDTKQHDFEKLEQAGFLRRTTTDEVAHLVHNGRELMNEVWRLYRTGSLPFESLCATTHQPAAAYFTTFVHVAGDGPTVLSAPVTPVDRPAPPLPGRHVLAGMLELLLLQHLGIWEPLRKALGGSGKLVMFRDVEEQLRDELGETLRSTQPDALKDEERLLALIDQSPRLVVARETGDETDAAWARTEGLPLIDDSTSVEGTIVLSAHGLARLLRERGAIREEQLSTIERGLPPEAALLPLPNPLPNRAGIGFTPLKTFFRADALLALTKLFHNGIEVGPRTAFLLRVRIDELQRRQEAADRTAQLQRAVGKGIAEGWIDATLPRPKASDLPPPRAGQEGEIWGALIHTPLTHMLGYKQALLDNPDLWLLTADFFVASDLSTQQESLWSFAWPSPEVGMDFIHRFRTTNERVIPFAMLARTFASGTSQKRLVGLAELGFIDALTTEDILSLVRGYGGVDKEEPRRILDRVEWMLRTPRHLGAVEAQLYLAGVYGRAIWQAWCDLHLWTDDEAKALTFALLGRAESAALHARGVILDHLFKLLVSQAVQERGASAEPSGPGLQHLSPTSRAARLWLTIASWTGPRGSRRAALERGLRYVWLLLDNIAPPHGPRVIMSEPVLLATTHGLPISAVPAALATPAIVTAGWVDSPLANSIFQLMQGTSDVPHQVHIERIYRHGAEQFASLSFNEWVCGFNFTVPDTSGELHFTAPPEALLLRANSEAVQKRAPELAALQGPLDGRAHDLLDRLSRAPDDKNLRREFARLTVAAPWRLVREDPGCLLVWRAHEAFGLGLPTTLSELRAMLSEPDEPLSDGEGAWDLLEKRVGDTGAWAPKSPDGLKGKRWDGGHLARIAAEIPGSIASRPGISSIGAFSDAALSQTVQGALLGLEREHQLPVGRLATYVYFLRFTAEVSPIAALPQGDVDLRERLSGTFVELLHQLRKPPLPDTFASIEAGLLRLCGRIVYDLDHGRELSMRDGLWLTYRLFQWVCMQLDALSPDDRAAALKVLAPSPHIGQGHNERAFVPAPNFEQAKGDVLHPLGFDREEGLDHRLAAVLYALREAEALTAEMTPKEQRRKFRRLSSRMLEDLVAKIAARPLTAYERALRRLGDSPSKLDWTGPATVPDLAIAWLLETNLQAFFRLDETARLRWIADLPQREGDLERAPWILVGYVAQAAARFADKLTLAERVALMAKAEAFDGDGAEDARLLVVCACFRAGDTRLEQNAKAAIEKGIDLPFATLAFGLYLVGVASIAPERLRSEAERILSFAEAKGGRAMVLAEALGRVIVTGVPAGIEPAKETLRGLAERAPYKDDPRMRRLLGLFGLL